MQTLILNHKFPSLNEVIGKASYNRFAYGAMKKKLTAYVAKECQIQGLKPTAGAIYVDFKWQEANKRRDFDNVCGSGQKFCLDGLKLAGVIKDDRQEFVKGITHTFSHGDIYQVTIKISPTNVWQGSNPVSDR